MKTLKHYLATILIATILTGFFAIQSHAQVTTAAVPSKKTVKDYPHIGEPPMPEVKAVLDVPLRDVSIGKGGDGYYYLTGTLGPDFMVTNEGIRLWKSKDMKKWEPLGLVWGIDRDGTWQKQWTEKNGNKRRALWAPEFHYINKNYYITYCITGLGTGILKSTSGKAEGPYVSVNTPDAPLTKGIDASLFQDDDGQVYFLYGSGEIAKMKADMSGLDGPTKSLRCITPDNDIEHHHPSRPCTDMYHVGFEGVYMFKANGKYYLNCAERYYERYHCMTAEATNIMGPYSARYVSVPYAGHNTFFQDDKGKWFCTMFGNDADAPIDKLAGIIPVTFDKNGHLMPQVK